MTEENYQYRASQTMLRNQFKGEGAFKTPIIPKPMVWGVLGGARYSGYPYCQLGK